MIAVTEHMRMVPRTVSLERALPLLEFLAAAHAHAVAFLWPAPHTGFYALPTARRHVAGMVVSGATHEPWAGERDVARLIERSKDADLARLVAGDKVPGLMKALARCGEQLWTREEYVQFLDLFTSPQGARLLRHSGAIRPAFFAPMMALPEVLRVPKIASTLTTVTAGRNLAEAFALVAARGDGKVAAERWGRAKDRAALFNMAAQDLTPPLFRAITPPPVLPPPFEAVKSRKALNAAALEFENCLRDYTGDIAAGRMAVYVWRGEPKAALALRHDAAGWRLAEARGKDNEDLPEAELREIVRVVTAAGVRTGRALNVLAGWLERHAHGHETEEAELNTYEDTLFLGDLWN